MSVKVLFVHITFPHSISTGFFSTDSDFVLLHGAPYWTDMFVRHFLFETDRSIDADDLLFFVRKKPIKGSTRFLMKYEVINLIIQP